MINVISAFYAHVMHFY